MPEFRPGVHDWSQCDCAGMNKCSLVLMGAEWRRNVRGLFTLDVIRCGDEVTRDEIKHEITSKRRFQQTECVRGG